MLVYDFFSGCGGTSAGLREAGLEVVLGIDFDEEAGRTFRRNFPTAAFIERDIRLVHAGDLEPYFEKPRIQPIVFSACAPCQPFSKQNRQKKADDDRQPLLAELHRFIKRFRPEYIFVENVPGMQKGCDQGGPFLQFKAFLSALGYATAHSIIESQKYGVPQHRQRLVLAASLVGPIELPGPTHGPGAPNPEFLTVWQAIGHYPPIAAGEELEAVANHRACSLSELNLKRIRATPEGGSRKDWPEDLLVNCHRNYDGHTDVYGRLHRNKPATALTTRCISLSNGRFGHPIQDRAISIREAAALQTFPDSFVFEGSVNSMAKQIGNAVPVALAKRFGCHFRTHYEGHMNDMLDA